MPDYSVFETSKWEKMTPFDRMEALQGLEISMAAEQGRTPRKVHPKSDFPSSTRGQYNPTDPGYLYINSSLINSNKENYQAMQTTIHEGRHAYQDDCVTGKAVALPQDANKIDSWSRNMPGRGGVYNQNDYTTYRFQPVEVDANNYAKERVNAIGSQYSQDSAFKSFCFKRDAQDRYSEMKAKVSYGADYEKVISQDIDKRFQAQSKLVSGNEQAQSSQMNPNNSAVSQTQAKQQNFQSAQKPVAPINQPSANKGIENMRSKTINHQTNAPKNTIQAGQNKGIEAMRQRTEQKQTGISASNTNQSANKGIESFKSKASGQATGSSQGGSAPATTNTPKSNANTQSKGNGQKR